MVYRKFSELPATTSLASGDTVIVYSGSQGKQIDIDDLKPIASDGCRVKSGFENRTDSSYEMNGADFEISPVSSSFSVFCDGVEYQYTETQSVTISNYGANFVFFTSEGLQVNTTSWDISSTAGAPCVIVYKTPAGRYIVMDERHSADRNPPLHEWAHDTIGARYESGFAVSSVSDSAFQISSGAYHDEDIDHEFSSKTSCVVWYRDAGGSYMETIATPSSTLAYISGGNLQYDTGTGLAAADNNKYVCNWLYANSDGELALVIGQAQHANITNARGESQPSFNGMETREMVLIHRFIWQNSAGGTYIESADYRSSSTLPGGSVSLAQAGSVIFTPSGDISSTNVQAAIEELDAEKMSITAGIDDLSDVAITTPADGDSLIYDEASGEWVNGQPSYSAESGIVTGYTDIADVTSADENKVMAVTVTEGDRVDGWSYDDAGISAETDFVDFWDFESASDVSFVNSYDWADAGSPTFGTGKHGNAITCNGSSSYAELAFATYPLMTLLATDLFTISLWVNLTATSKYIAGGYASSNGLELYIDSLGRPVVKLYGNFSADKTHSTAVNTGSWVHLVIRKDDTDMDVFVNGSKESFSGCPVIGSVTNAFMIGGTNEGGTRYYGGPVSFDAIAIWGSAISDDSVASLYNSGDGSFLESTASEVIAVEPLDLGTVIDNATAKTTPVDADMLPLMDSADSNLLKKLSWSNLKATVKAYFDTLYVALTGNQTVAGKKTFSDKINITNTDDPIVYTDTTASLHTEGGISVKESIRAGGVVSGRNSTNPTYQAFRAMNQSEGGYAAWDVTYNGVMRWGAGTDPQDIHLYRYAANVLKTDDAFVVGSTTASTSTTSGALTVAGGLGVSGAVYTGKAGAIAGKEILAKTADYTMSLSDRGKCVLLRTNSGIAATVPSGSAVGDEWYVTTTVSGAHIHIPSGTYINGTLDGTYDVPVYGRVCVVNITGNFLAFPA